MSSLVKRTKQIKDSGLFNDANLTLLNNHVDFFIFPYFRNLKFICLKSKCDK